MKRTMHVVLTMPVEVLDPTLSEEEVTRLVPQWIREGLRWYTSLPLRPVKNGCEVCTVYAVREEKDD